MVEYPDRLWADRDPTTNEKQWFSIEGMGTEFVRADIYAAVVAENEEQARLLGMGAERELELRSEIDRLKRGLMGAAMFANPARAVKAEAINEEYAEKICDLEAEVEQLTKERDELATAFTSSCDIRERQATELASYRTAFDDIKPRTGNSVAVKVKELEWVELSDGKVFRALLPIIGSIRIEPYGVCGWWEVLWSMPGQCDKLIPDVFDTPDEAKAAAQADYERRAMSIIEATATHADFASVEPAPPEGQQEPVDDAAYWKGAYDRMSARNATMADALILAVGTLDDLASGVGLSRPIEQIIRELNDVASSGGCVRTRPSEQAVTEAIAEIERTFPDRTWGILPKFYEGKDWAGIIFDSGSTDLLMATISKGSTPAAALHSALKAAMEAGR